MPYAGTVNFFSFESDGIQGTGPLVGTNVEATRQTTPQGNLVWREVVNDTTTAPLTANGAPFTFPSGLSAPLGFPSYVGLRFARTGAPGPVFRSGYRDSLPIASGQSDLSADVDIVELPWQTVSRVQLADSVASGAPITKDDITIDTLNAILNEGYFRVTASGSTVRPVLGLINFRYGVDVRLTAETAMSTDVPQNLVDVALSNDSLELTSAGPSPAETAVVLQLVRPFVVASTRSTVSQTIARLATSAAYEEVGRFTGRTNGVGTVPDSVILTAERVVIGTFTPGGSRPATFGVHLLLAAGTFGSVINTLYPAGPPGSGGGGCAVVVVGMLAGVGSAVLAGRDVRSVGLLSAGTAAALAGDILGGRVRTVQRSS